MSIMIKFRNIDKSGHYFPAFSFLGTHCLVFWMKTTMKIINVNLLKTAQTIQLSIDVPDSMVPIIGLCNN